MKIFSHKEDKESEDEMWSDVDEEDLEECSSTDSESLNESDF